MELERGQLVSYLPCVIKGIPMSRTSRMFKGGKRTSIFDASPRTAPKRSIGGMIRNSNSSAGMRESQYSAASQLQFDKCHVFHFDCLKEWLSDNNRCPVCNIILSENLTSFEALKTIKNSGCQENELLCRIIERS